MTTADPTPATPAAAVPALGPADLYSREGLVRLDARFLARLDDVAPALAARLRQGRGAPPSRGAPEESALWLDLAPHVDAFLVSLFGIEAPVAALRARHEAAAVLSEARRKFVQRYATRRVDAATLTMADGAALRAAVERHLGQPYTELAFAAACLEWLAREAACADALDAAARFAVWAAATPAGRAAHRHGVLFSISEKRDPLVRFPTETVSRDGLAWRRAPALQPRRQRCGFELSDPGCSVEAAAAEIAYCIFCHHQAKDSCSIGFRDAAGDYQKTALGAQQTGCPLGERISEMHEARQLGHVLSALAIACVDNPMVAGTGHRICNDCMVACIYQKQHRDPVNVPQAETRILKDVLALPWGFEIYSLLTRWNPFNLERPVPRPPTGRSVLVVGLGPAGYTLAHHLLNDGHCVVAIDGLKVEPLAAGIGARDVSGRAQPFRLVRDFGDLREPLGQRVNAGFGGVAEYGITVRWDKNFLKVVRLLLERRAEFALHGGVRFGGAVTPDSAFAAGFDHVALCMGAGKPTVLGIPHGLAPGVRQASDFLMALQLTGAGRADTVANLQVRLPIVVVGGGLTAIDTCTEALAYYPVQVEKFLSRYEQLCALHGVATVRRDWNAREAEVADEFLAHAALLREVRARAAREGREADVAALLAEWGGARIAYRRTLAASPAYRNHEEVEKALEEGIEFGEQLTPLAVEVDSGGDTCGLRVRAAADGAEHVLPARTILVAAGTVPNTVLAREHAGIALDGKYFQARDASGQPVTPERSTKPAAAHVLTRVLDDGRALSFFGDLHPSYAGNVVAAMASAKHGYPLISTLLARRPSHVDAAALREAMRAGLAASVVRVERLTHSIVEVVVHAPFAARAFRPGQFFRLQNYEACARVVDGTRLVMEGLALTGAWVDESAGHVGLITLEMGGSSSLCDLLAAGEPVVLMGPTGEPTEIPANQTVLLAGGGLGNAVLFSIGRALRANGCRVLYFAGYRSGTDVFRRADIEAAADVVVWCSDRAPAPAPAASRPADRVFVGNIVAAMTAYAEGALGEPALRIADVDRIIAIGSDRMMAAVAAARHAALAPHLKPGHVALASINSPMQCMMKEVCAQCLQTHRDPLTGVETVVFTCANQDQPMDLVSFPGLGERLRQNSVQEKLTAQWIAACRATGAPR